MALVRPALHDAGWVSVATSITTRRRSLVETLRRWRRRMGCVSYPVAVRRPLITADGGRFELRQPQGRLWTWELQRVRRRDGPAAGLGVPLCRLVRRASGPSVEPPDVRRITENWRGLAVRCVREVVVDLIGHTTTSRGRPWRFVPSCDENSYPTGQPVTAEQMESLQYRSTRSGTSFTMRSWNYSLMPRLGSEQHNKPSGLFWPAKVALSTSAGSGKSARRPGGSGGIRGRSFLGPEVVR